MKNQLVLLKKLSSPLLFIFPNCTFINIIAAAFGDLAYPVGYIFGGLSHPSCSARCPIVF